MERHALWMAFDLYCSCREDRQMTSKIDGLLEPIINENKHVTGFICLDCKAEFKLTLTTSQETKNG